MIQKTDTTEPVCSMNIPDRHCQTTGKVHILGKSAYYGKVTDINNSPVDGSRYIAVDCLLQ